MSTLEKPQRFRDGGRAITIFVAVLEFLAGGIVVLGGSALVTFSIDTLGKGLGVIHLALGLAAFPAGYALWTRRGQARSLALTVNVATIVFSIVSEGVLSASGSLPSGAFFDSIIGTGVAVILGALVIYSLTRRGAWNTSPERTGSTLRQAHARFTS